MIPDIEVKLMYLIISFEQETTLKLTDFMVCLGYLCYIVEKLPKRILHRRIKKLKSELISRLTVIHKFSYLTCGKKCILRSSPRSHEKNECNKEPRFACHLRRETENAYGNTLYTTHKKYSSYT